MDKQQIKDLIAQNITGQGNQVDISGKLAANLDAIVDEIPEGGESIPVLEVNPFAEGEVTTEEELFSKIKLNGTNITSLDQLEELKNRLFFITTPTYAAVEFIVPIYRYVDKSDGNLILFSCNAQEEEMGVNIFLQIADNGEGDFSASFALYREF